MSASQYPARPDRFGASSKIGDLLDRLESLVNEGVRFPMTSKVMIEEEEFIEIIDSLREAVSEAQYAARGSAEPQIPSRPAATPYPGMQPINSSLPANSAGTDSLAGSDIVQIAQQRAESLVAEAEQRARETVAGADAYAMDVLNKLESELNRLVATVRRGKTTLESNTPQQQAAPPSQPGDSPAPTRPRPPIMPQYLTGRDDARRRAGLNRDRP